MADKLEDWKEGAIPMFRQLAEDYQGINLGTGFPDTFPPDHVREALMQAIQTSSPLGYQYTRPAGHPRYVKALANLYSPKFGREIDPLNEVLVTNGATGSLYSAVNAVIDTGDEVIIIEPFYEKYKRLVELAGAVPVYIPLRPTKPNTTNSRDFKLDPEELASKFNIKTKAIFFNTPNNPMGKVFTREETELVASLCKKHDVVVFADEVYEFLVYHPNEHVKIATLPDMWERTLTIGSAGKVFDATGLRSGWTIGPKHLVKACQKVHQNVAMSCSSPIQEALAISVETEIGRLNQSDSFLERHVLELIPKRDFIVDQLKKAGFDVIIPEAGYFVIADFSKKEVEYEDDTDDTEDFKFAKWMVKEKKLAGIPLTPFYSNEHRELGEHFIRFCFCKGDECLQNVAQILQNWN